MAEKGGEPTFGLLRPARRRSPPARPPHRAGAALPAAGSTTSTWGVRRIRRCPTDPAAPAAGRAARRAV